VQTSGCYIAIFIHQRLYKPHWSTWMPFR